MKRGVIYKEKKTNSCYICVESSERYAYLLDISYNSISGNIKDDDFVEATDEDILRDAKTNFQLIMQDNE